MKKPFYKKPWFWVLVCIFAFIVYSQIDNADSNTSSQNESNDSQVVAGTTIKKEEPVDIKDNKEEKNIAELKKDALSFPLQIVSTDILKQTDDSSEKNLYPDLYSVQLKNTTTADIKEYTVAILAWDENDLPVKIKGKISFSDGSYIVRVGTDDANLVPDATTKKDSGFELHKSMKLKTLQAIVLDYTDFDGNVVENDKADAYLDAIEGKKIK